MSKVSKSTKYDVLSCILSTKYVEFNPHIPTKKQQPFQKPFYIPEIIHYNFHINLGRVSGIKSA
jgi:hypothetical protein